MCQKHDEKDKDSGGWSFVSFPCFVRVSVSFLRFKFLRAETIALIAFERRRWSFELIYGRYEVSKLIMEEVMFFEFRLQDKWSFELISGERKVSIEKMKIWFRVRSVLKEKMKIIFCYEMCFVLKNDIVLEFSYQLDGSIEGICITLPIGWHLNRENKASLL